MQIENMRCDASTRVSVGAAGLSGRMLIGAMSEGDEEGCRSAAGASANGVGGGSFDPEAITLLQSVLDEAWASLRPERRACTSRRAVAKRVLELAATGERDRTRLCNFARA